MTKNNISKAISMLLVFLLCVGVLAMISRFTNGFKEDFKSFYISYDGKDIFSSRNKLFLSRGEVHRFDVTYVFEFLDEGEESKREYTVKIIPNVDNTTDFTFMVDGYQYAYSDVDDLTNGFHLEKQDSYFLLSISKETNLKSVLEGVLGKDVEVPQDEYCSSPYLYTLIITSYDKSVTYYIDFAVGVGVNNIKLNTDKVAY